MNFIAFIKNKAEYRFLVIFLATFCILSGGTYLLIGFIEPSGKYYSPFLANYVDFINPYIHAIMSLSKRFLEWCGYIADYKAHNQLRVNGYNSVTLAYQCAGVGVISLWLAFIFADNAPAMSKLKWLLIGFVLITVINALRISLLLVAHYENWRVLKGISHHDFYNYVVYSLFIILIMLYAKYTD